MNAIIWGLWRYKFAADDDLSSSLFLRLGQRLHGASQQSGLPNSRIGGARTRFDLGGSRRRVNSGLMTGSLVACSATEIFTGVEITGGEKSRLRDVVSVKAVGMRLR